MQCRVFGHEYPLMDGWWFDVVWSVEFGYRFLYWRSAEGSLSHEVSRKARSLTKQFHQPMR